MESNPKPYYFDPISQKNICVKFEDSGYCSQMMACPYLHRTKFNNQPALKKKVIPEKKEVISQFNLFDQQNQDQYNEKIIPLLKAIKKPNIPKPKEPREPKYNAIFKKQVKPNRNQKPCHNCKMSHYEENVFCNSFCGHLFCYRCIKDQDMCIECTVPFDKETAEIFFMTYCKNCEKQNMGIIRDGICKRCVSIEELTKAKQKEEQTQLSKMKENPLLCIICFNGKKQFCVFPCAHMLYCEMCVEHLKKSQVCYFCNGRAQNIKKIFY